MEGLIDGSDAWAKSKRDEFAGSLKDKPGLRRFLAAPPPGCCASTTPRSPGKPAGMASGCGNGGQPEISSAPVGGRVSVPRVDIEDILDSVEAESPGLRDIARRFLEDQARHLGVPLDLASVMARQVEGEPEVHVEAAADELIRHLSAQPGALGGGSALMALARAGAYAMVPRIETR